MSQQQREYNQIKKFEIKYQPWETSSDNNSIQYEKFSRLEQVNIELSGNNRTDIKMVINQLKLISNLHNLQSLKIHNGYSNKCNGVAFKEMLQTIFKFRTLKNLSLLFDTDVIQLDEFSYSDVETILKDLSDFPPMEQIELTINRNNITCQQILICSLILMPFINLKNLKIEIKDNLVGHQGFLYLYKSFQNLKQLEEFTLSIINNKQPVDFGRNLWNTISSLKSLNYFKVQIEDCKIVEQEQVGDSFQGKSHLMLKTLILDLQGVKNKNQENLISSILANLSYFPQLIQLTINFEKNYQIDQKGLMIFSECLGKMHNLKYLWLNFGINNQVQSQQIEVIFSKIQQFHSENQLMIEQDENYDLIMSNSDQLQQDYTFQLKFFKDKENSCQISKGVEQGIKYFQELKKLIIKLKGKNQYIISSLENSSIDEIELYFGSTNYNFNSMADLLDSLNNNQLKSLKIITHNHSQVEPETIQKFYSNLNKQKYLQNCEYTIGNQIKHRDEMINHLSDQISNSQSIQINTQFTINEFDEEQLISVSLNSFLEKLSNIQNLEFFINTSDSNITLYCSDDLRSIYLCIVYSKDCASLLESFLFGFYYLVNLKQAVLSILNTQHQIFSKDYISKTSQECIKLNEMIDFEEMANAVRQFQKNSFIISTKNQSIMMCNLMKPFKQQKVLKQFSQSINPCLEEYLSNNKNNLGYIRELNFRGYINLKYLSQVIPQFSALEILDITIQQESSHFHSTIFELIRLQSLKKLIMRINFPGIIYDYIVEMNQFVSVQNISEYNANQLNYLNIQILGINLSKYRYKISQDNYLIFDSQRMKLLLPRLIYFI